MQLIVELFGSIAKVALRRILPTSSLGRTTTRPTAILIIFVVKPAVGAQAAFAKLVKPRPVVNKAPVISIFFIYKPPQS